MKLRCIVIDDESLGRKLMAEHVEQIPFLELVGTCRNAFEAMEILEREYIDLMFLDIQMPGLTGTKFLESLKSKPMVVLVTAYAQYAVESYNLDVLDYIMKPVSLERFTKAAYKALEIKRLQHQQASDRTGTNADSFFVNVEYALVKVTVPEILFVESMKDYVKIYQINQVKPIITKATLKSIEERLPSEDFQRVHKSYIVRVDKIEAIKQGKAIIGQHEIPVSETHMPDLMRSLKHES